jgi:ABC-type transport system substrate-binding protein
MKESSYKIFRPLIKLIKWIEDTLYLIRDFFWDYPNIFSEDRANQSYIVKIYKSSIPYSHFVLSSILVILISIPLFIIEIPKISGNSGDILIEGVVMGIDQNGDIQKINKVNPLLPSNIQLERDLVNLIYEPLFKYEYVPYEEESGRFIGGVNYVLADSIVTIKPGADYQINLKNDVMWHDGANFTSDDVISTFDILNSIDESQTSTNAYTKALRQMQWQKIDDYTIRICTLLVDSIERKGCNESDNNPIFSNFLELISFKIIPKHLSQDINSTNASSTEPQLYRSPVGTGMYKFENNSNRGIELEFFEDFHGYRIVEIGEYIKYKKAIDSADEITIQNNDNLDELKYKLKLADIHKIGKIHFTYFKTLEEAINALQNGEVHTLVSNSSTYKDTLKNYPQVNIYSSPVLYNQFWGLYFNLRKRPDGASIAPGFIQDKKVRQAISAAISRKNIVENALDGIGEEAKGPIPDISYFFNPNAGWYQFDKTDPNKLLAEAGWTIKSGNEFRTNDKGEVLRVSLYFVNSYDRQRVAETIKVDLARVGIDVVINREDQTGQGNLSTAENGWSLEDLNNQILAPRLFDIILYGMNTFVDPDRYELYHTSQIDYPGLNISGYSSTEQTVDRNPNKGEGQSSLINVPKVDRFLEQARSFNPVENRKERKDRYDEVQRMIAEDVPLVFLYHPQFIYYVNNRVENMNLAGVNGIEDRFLNINEWEISE